MYRILIVDDDTSFLKVYSKILKRNGYEVESVDSPLKALELLHKESFSLVITDMVMPKMNGIGLLKEIRKDSQSIDVILLTGEGSIETAVNAMKEGAYTYLTKPVNVEELLIEIEKCLRFRSLHDENQYLKEELLQAQEEFLGESPAIKEIKKKIAVVAPTDAAILLTGESGTGKELTAELIHRNSGRKDKPLIKVNCAALVESILESELFGHEKGAFTGALYERKGRFELADQGTLFLDEIGDISPNIQTKLLRVLQEKEFERVGGNKTISVDFRLITATNKNLKAEVEKGNFREDLYYRLNVIPIHLPPLRERREDIPCFLSYFLEKFSRKMRKEIRDFTPEAKKVLIEYNWPGNIRELKNIVERLVVFAQGSVIGIEHLPEEIKNGFREEKNIQTLRDARREFEIAFLQKALARNDGNISRTAEEIGLARKNLQVKIKEYGLMGRV
jgi:DNA-binding NtrC family response regulator